MRHVEPDRRPGGQVQEGMEDMVGEATVRHDEHAVITMEPGRERIHYLATTGNERRVRVARVQPPVVGHARG